MNKVTFDAAVNIHYILASDKANLISAVTKVSGCGIEVIPKLQFTEFYFNFFILIKYFSAVKGPLDVHPEKPLNSARVSK